MSHKTCVPLCSIGVFVVGLCCAAPSASATVIAYWRFEPGSFLVDSSGNGHTLTGTATSDTAVADINGGAGSALFNGTSDALQTATSLDLSGITSTLRVSFALRADGTSGAGNQGIFFEHSTNFGSNPGTLLLDVNEIVDGSAGVAAWRLTSPPASQGYNIDQLPHATDNVTWDLFQVDFNPNTLVAADVVQVTKNGTLLGDTTAYGLHGTTSAQSFINAVLYLGARAGNSSFFKGNLDEVKIETLVPAPEPNGCVMLLVGGAALCLRRARRK